MAEILRLPQRRRPASPPALGPEEGKILFFTGVRYQRAETAPSGPAPRKGGEPSGTCRAAGASRDSVAAAGVNALSVAHNG